MRKALVPVAMALGIALSPAKAAALSCVPFAREVSGITLIGDAWRWWSLAAGQYERGRKPREMAVMVFAPQGAMTRGHVAVVRRAISNRVILVDHANWAPAGSSGRGEIDRAVRVADVSAANDWSMVKVWFGASGEYGGTVYRAYGFIYRQPTIARADKSHFPQPAFAVESSRSGNMHDGTGRRFARQ